MSAFRSKLCKSPMEGDMRAWYLCSLRLFCAVAGGVLLFCLLPLLTLCADGSRAAPDVGPAVAEGAQPFADVWQMAPLRSSADVRPFSCSSREGHEARPVAPNRAPLPAVRMPQNPDAGQE